VPLDPAAVRAYLSRDWDRLADDTERHRAEMHRRDPEWTWRVAAALRHQVAIANPAWPSAHDRDADFAHHIHLRELLDRAAHGLRRR
jgi:hypothetical protein